MRPHRLRTASATVATIAMVLTLLVVVRPPGAEADTGTTAAAQVLSPTAVSVSWPASSETTSWIVEVALRDGTKLGRRTVCGECTSARFDQLTPGTSYSFTVVGVGAPSGGIWANALATTPRDPLCAAVASCIAVDTTSSAGPTTGVGLGLLRGLTPGTDRARVDAVDLRYHRVGAWEEPAFTSARQAGGDIDVVLSDAWPRFTVERTGRLQNPWEDWSLYQSFVSGVVYWHIAHGLVPEYWEIQNEPEQAAWYKSTDPTARPTRERVLEQMRVAHDAIRAQLPDAKIVGPSLGSFEPAAGDYIDMKGFLDYVSASGLRFDVIAWHAMGGDCAGACDGGPRAIPQQVATVRQMIAERPELGHPQIHINELGGPLTVADPGYAVGYFSAVSSSRVDEAGSSCWPADYGTGHAYSGCQDIPGTMDNLLMPDGSTPRAAWWVWQSYAAARGQLVPASVSHADMSVWASLQPGTATVLVGSHPATGRAATATAPRLRVKVGPLVSRVDAKVTTIEVSSGASRPSVRTYRGIKVSKGVVDLGTLNVPAHAAVVVELTSVGLVLAAPVSEATAITSTTSTTATTSTTSPRGRR